MERSLFRGRPAFHQALPVRIAALLALVLLAAGCEDSGQASARHAVALALTENVVLYPLAILVDRKHPRHGERHLPPLWSRRVFAQETFRHALFGLVLGSLVGSARSGDGTQPVTRAR